MNKRLKKKIRKKETNIYSIENQDKLDFKSEKERKAWVSYVTNA